MTLQEAKDQVRKNHYYGEWNEKMIDEVAELYARSKWDECYKYLHDHSYDCVFPDKPEFKP